MLTGLEQYSLERAGYFIRRAAVSPDLLEDALAVSRLNRGSAASNESVDAADSGAFLALAGAIEPTVRDILGTRVSEAALTLSRSEARPADWRRALGRLSGSPADQTAALAARGERVEVRIPLEDDDSLVVLPGTHTSPPDQQDAAALECGGAAPGQVRIRLRAGDALFWNPNLFHRYEGAGDTAGCTLAVTFPPAAKP